MSRFAPRTVPSRLRHTGNDSPHLPPLRDHFAAVDKKNTQTLPGLTPAFRFVLRVRTTPPAFARQFSAPPHPHPLIRAHARPFVVQHPPPHSCPFVSIRGSNPPHSFVPHSHPFVVQPHPLHSCPCASIRGSTPTPFIRVHSCSFASIRGSTPTPSFVDLPFARNSAGNIATCS